MGTTSSAPAPTLACSSAPSSRSSSPSPASAPPSRCTRWSRQNEAVALGFVATRTFEACMIFIGVVSLLSLMTLRQELAGATGANGAALVVTGASLVATYNWTFMLGQTLMPGFNALLLGSLMYRSGLVPRIIPSMALIGAPLLIAAVFLTLFGVLNQGSTLQAVGALPVAAWEFSLGVWLAEGLESSPITAEMIAPGTQTTRA
ncbi:MAG TPA: DUF4386 domain-containing protein [Chloroflexota bacterium]